MKEFLILAFGLTMVYLSLTSRYAAYVRVIALQGIILFLLVMSDWATLDLASASLLAIETLGFKAIAIPLLLSRILAKSGFKRESEANIPQFYSIVLETLIVLVGFYAAWWAKTSGMGLKPLFFGISIANMLTALFIIVTRKRILTHVMGYMLLENGIFLLSLSIAAEMPFIVNIGVLLDIFIALFIFGLFIVRIQSTYEDITVDRLTDLRD